MIFFISAMIYKVSLIVQKAMTIVLFEVRKPLKSFSLHCCTRSFTLILNDLFYNNVQSSQVKSV